MATNETRRPTATEAIAHMVIGTAEYALRLKERDAKCVIDFQKILTSALGESSEAWRGAVMTTYMRLSMQKAVCEVKGIQLSSDLVSYAGDLIDVALLTHPMIIPLLDKNAFDV